ncbi:MAG: alpha/beta hydrolase [Candidatus Hodarchaeales archaeon]|jgi:carboxylesterase
MKQNKSGLEHLKELAKPFYFEGLPDLGLLLVHGFTASPSEMLPLGKFLHEKGYTVSGVRLAGHGTDYRDLPKHSWQDWYRSVEEGFIHLKNHCDAVIPIGLSMGAILCLNLVYQHPEENFPKLCLLAPAFAIKSRMARFAPLFRFFIKFTFKGEETLRYFKDHHLYSYMYRPIDSIIQLFQLLKYIHKQPIHISIPTLIAYGVLDESISINSIKKAIREKFNPETNIKILELRKSHHILPVEPDAEELFRTIELFLKK